MRIIFFGSGYYTIPIVKQLLNHGLVLVVTTEPRGRFVDFLKKKKIPYMYSKLKSVKDISKVENLKPDIGILASYGAILPKKIIEIFPLGILNVHPSLLPQYKGSSPIQFTILDGSILSGVTVIKLDDKVDHGPIVMQTEVKLSGKETLESMTELMFLEGSLMIKKIVQKLTSGEDLRPYAQSIKGESFTRKIEKEDGKIELSNPPLVEELNRRIRAFYPWPGVHLNVSLGEKMKILKLMPNDTVQVEGKNPMDFKNFINGYGKDAKLILEKLGLN